MLQILPIRKSNKVMKYNTHSLFLLLTHNSLSKLRAQNFLEFAVKLYVKYQQENYLLHKKYIWLNSTNMCRVICS